MRSTSVLSFLILYMVQGREWKVAGHDQVSVMRAIHSKMSEFSFKLVLFLFRACRNVGALGISFSSNSVE